MDDMELIELLNRFNALSLEEQEDVIEALEDFSQAEQNRIIASISDRNTRMAVVRALKAHNQQLAHEVAISLTQFPEDD